jgi:cyclase
MDADGTRAGYDLGMIKAIRAVSRVPLIASGGAGSQEDFAAALDAGADALLAASIFHFGMHRIGDIKSYLDRSGYPVRTTGHR